MSGRDTHRVSEGTYKISIMAQRLVVKFVL